jgi:hypothetical protein
MELRETPLDICPDPSCKRSGICHSTDTRCRKLYMTDDERREKLVHKLRTLWVQLGLDVEDFDKPAPEPSPEAWADLYNTIRERAADVRASAAQPKPLRRKAKADCESKGAPLNPRAT